ncbi:MAG: hypothetical protein FD189_2072 [Elusimicrobia bacterium]|nr:MAG: hypothetical protein FD154_1774 [Elusimicrobiota bacterium]KAF0154122.1 MAG: hypothetical protein FD189_2072 [Elusimicrobiota bacterium]
MTGEKTVFRYLAVVIAGAVAVIMAGGIDLPALAADCYSFESCVKKGYASKAPEERIEYNTKAIEYWRYRDGNKNKAIAYHNRGFAYGELKQYDKAIADFDKAIELNPEDVHVDYRNRGVAYRKLKQYDKAIADYDKAIELNPKDADTYHNRGFAYDELKQYDKAIADYNKAIELNPEYADAYFNRGFAYDELKQYDKAIADYDKAIKLNPEYAYAYNNRGYTYLWLKKCDKAQTDFKKANKLDAKDPVPYGNLGNYWWACRKNKVTAFKWFEKSFRLGFDRWDELYDETSDGHFLKGLNDTPEFKALVKKYRKGGKALVPAAKPGE